MNSSFDPNDLLQQTNPIDKSWQQEVGKLCSVAIKYISSGKKSSGKVRRHLLAKDYPEDLIQAAIEELIVREYIDDRLIASRIIRQRSGKKAVARKAMVYYLQVAGIEQDIIDEELAHLPADEETIVQLVKAKFEHSQPSAIDQAKVIRFLCARGYHSSLATRTVMKLLEPTS